MRRWEEDVCVFADVLDCDFEGKYVAWRILEWLRLHLESESQVATIRSITSHHGWRSRINVDKPVIYSVIVVQMLEDGIRTCRVFSSGIEAWSEHKLFVANFWISGSIRNLHTVRELL